jgi:hypothetical protein
MVLGKVLRAAYGASDQLSNPGGMMRSLPLSRRGLAVLAGTAIAATTMIGLAGPASAAPLAGPATTIVITEVPQIAPTTFALHGHLEVTSSGAVVRNAVIQVLRNGAVTKSATTNNSGNVAIPVTVNAGTTVDFKLKFPGNNTFTMTTSGLIEITNL